MSEADDAKMIRESGIFDEKWYVEEYPDVAVIGLDPAEHYLKIGARLGRSPGPFFDAPWYLEQHEDVRAAGVNPLLHYLRYGRIGGPEVRGLAETEDGVTGNAYGAPAADWNSGSAIQQCVAVVVPVFNALEDTQRCLSALEERKDGFELAVYVVNDGSDAVTSAWLREFCSGRAGFQLVEHPRNLGYTCAVNSGLRLSKAPYSITLNSDTIVTHGWLRSLVRCAESDPSIGIVGPLSNAASWQNVPALRDGDGNFAVNQLPQGVTPDEFAQWVRSSSQQRYPRLPFINGFCFLIRRAVIDAIGLLDQDTFPLGYGEENDYCIRASDAGYALAVADDAYVCHAKSKSFGHERRAELSRRASELLRTKHGKDRFNALVEQVGVQARQLDAIREDVAAVIGRQLARKAGQPAQAQRPSRLPRMATTDMHGTPVTLLPPPVYGAKEYDVEPTPSGPCLLLPFDAPLPATRSRQAARCSIAVHLHLHYNDLLPEFIRFLKNIPYRYSLYVSVASPSLVDSTASQLTAELPLAQVEVRSFPNRGRDIAPFIVGFGRQILGHEIVCHIHSKRSPHSGLKADWRRQLLVNLMGSSALVASMLDCLRDNKHLGMLFPEYHHSLRGQISWGTNFAIAEHLARRLRLPIRKEDLAIFPAGSMFWARVDAISSLFEAGLTWEDFPQEAAQIDGTLAHAVERLFGEVVVGAGYDLIQTKSDKQYSLFSYFPHRWPYRPSLSEAELTRLTATYRQERASARARPAPRAVVYTALTGGYEQPVVHESLAAELAYLLFTDSPADDRGFWDVRRIPYRNEQPVRRARHIKTNPHRYLADFDIAVWIDANVVIRGDMTPYVRLAVEHPDIPLFGIPHPHRNCLYDESKAVVAAKKDDDETVQPQIARYRQEGYPARHGLIETNLLVINLRHPQTAAIFDEWWRQIETGSHRDQLSLNYALWKVGATWMPIFKEKVTLRDSFDFAYLGHGRNSGYPALKIGGAKRVNVSP